MRWSHLSGLGFRTFLGVSGPLKIRSRRGGFCIFIEGGPYGNPPSLHVKLVCRRYRNGFEETRPGSGTIGVRAYVVFRPRYKEMGWGVSSFSDPFG